MFKVFIQDLDFITAPFWLQRLLELKFFSVGMSNWILLFCLTLAVLITVDIMAGGLLTAVSL